jgi:hypothetical protein
MAPTNSSPYVCVGIGIARNGQREIRGRLSDEIVPENDEEAVRAELRQREDKRQNQEHVLLSGQRSAVSGQLSAILA